MTIRLRLARPGSWLSAAVLVATLALMACGEDQTCADGSQKVDGQCVADLVCGPGTEAVGERCVVTDAVLDLVDAADTTDAADDANGTDAADAVCVPDCHDVPCEGDDGCGGQCGQLQPDGSCVPTGCVPRCTGRECGDDGCGGSCGGCAEPGRPVCQDGTCVVECVPSCSGRECGDDGCGGSCGDCDGGHGCSSHGHCVPDAWTCPESTYDALDHCDCACGAPDPDCESNLFLATVGCDAFEACSAGQCEPTVPLAWTCSPLAWDDGDFCHCDCGAPDPDCAASPQAPVIGCQTGETCGATGLCEACVPECTGRACGDDGCGGSCGDCTDANVPFCGGATGQCVAQCTPDCTGRTCGDDGCGGSCGTCQQGASCVDDAHCRVPPESSCAGNCQVTADSGCSCQPGCELDASCCVDYVALCTCQPDCAGRTCGDDGCGGSCGDCTDPGLSFCDPQGQCQAQCTPECTGRSCGDDGCGSSCGSCPGNEACSPGGQCVPETWICPPHQYGDTLHCDCSCGAPDPDCATLGETVGCPFDARCVAATGLCDVTYCTNEAACTGPAMCVGHYPTGEPVARYGVCHAPLPGAMPGLGCAVDDDCATGLCVAGTCRQHCQQTSDCPADELCIGVALHEPISGLPLGGVGVCDAHNDFGAPCSAQSACGPTEMCLLVFDPVTHQPAPRCGVPRGGRSLGASCDLISPCALGLLCADGVCAEPCPGGVADCPGGYTCQPVIAHEGGLPQSSDDLFFDACVAP